jgi:DNA gyrase/topoisomerase IV subunit B
MSKAKENDNREIVTLEYRQHVLSRSGMYIGSTDKRGLHHLISSNLPLLA